MQNNLIFNLDKLTDINWNFACSVIDIFFLQLKLVVKLFLLEVSDSLDQSGNLCVPKLVCPHYTKFGLGLHRSAGSKLLHLFIWCWDLNMKLIDRLKKS